jgi:hypothetical protein
MKRYSPLFMVMLKVYLLPQAKKHEEKLRLREQLGFVLTGNNGQIRE